MNPDERAELMAAAYDALALSWWFWYENRSACNSWTYDMLQQIE
jgi:hypothetical protein